MPIFRLEHDVDAVRVKWGALMLFAVGLCLATGALVWLGYVATREWSRGTDRLLKQHEVEAISLVGAALNRDMRGLWATVIVPISQRTIAEEPPHDLVQLAAGAFARFPYPESIVIWKANGSRDGRTYALNRTDRRSHWDTGNESADPFPVQLVEEPWALRHVVAALRQQAVSGQSVVLLETNIAGVPYQIVARLLFASTAPYALSGLAGFTVNLQWTRAEYFGPLLAQVATIGGTKDMLSIAVIDEGGGVVAAVGSPTPTTGDRKLTFPLLFLDAELVSPGPSRRAAVREWGVYVRPSADNAPLAAHQGAQRMFVLMSLAAAISMLALLLTVRAIRASAVLASLKSDFISNVTHELKTPLALIRLVGDTLAGGRYRSTETVQEYAQLLSQEALRLSQSIDKLLTYARYSNSSKQTSIELKPTNVADLVEGALQAFIPTLDQLEFKLEVDVPSELPPVSADGPAMIRVIENIIDNAIKYAGDRRVLSIAARRREEYVQLTFMDRGTGIGSQEIAHVFGRFYRGRNAKENSSGLGLAIAKRIVRCHGGKIEIRSTIDVGTEVDLLLVVAKQA